MKAYTSFEEIEEELKELDLKRQIAVEELKLTSHQVKEDLSVSAGTDFMMNILYKYGLSFLFKRLFRKSK